MIGFLRLNQPGMTESPCGHVDCHEWRRRRTPCHPAARPTRPWAMRLACRTPYRSPLAHLSDGKRAVAHRRQRYSESYSRTRPASGQEPVDESNFAPAAETWAQTVVVSMLSSFVSAIISGRVTNTTSQVPASLQRLNRRSAVFHMPYFSGTWA